MTFLILKGLLVTNIVYAFFIIYTILTNTATMESFKYFLFLSVISTVYYYIYTFINNFKNKKNNKKTKKEKTQSQKNRDTWANDGFENHNRTGRIFDDKEDRTIKDKEHFEEWKKDNFNFSYKEPELDKEFIILNISKEEKDILTKSLLKKKYYLLAQIYHPDKDTGDIDKMQEINEAYKTLSKRYK